MKRLFLLLAIIAITGSGPVLFAQTTLEIRHINVVDVATGKVLPDQRVTISGNRITAIAKDKGKRATAAATQIDGKGKYLIPGLWDMHYHSTTAKGTKASIFPLMLANGITGARHLWGNQELLQLRDSVERGLITGPRQVVGSPIIDGPMGTIPGIFKIGTTARVPVVIDSLHALGYDFIKTYEFLDNEVFFAIADYCRSKNIRFAGHTPVGVTVEQASKAGIRSIEHLTGMSKAFSLQEDSLNRVMTAVASEMKGWEGFVHTFFENEHHSYPFNKQKAERVARVLARNNTAVVPTLSIYRGYLFHPDTLARLPELAYMPKGTRKAWYNSRKDGPVDTRYFEKELDILRFLHQNGVTVLAGSDAPNSYVVYGFSLHDELEWYQQAGLSPLAALQTATLNPARFLNREHELGTVAKGKLADLVILNTNPLGNIKNARDINAVIANGKLLTRAELDGMLLKLRKRFE